LACREAGSDGACATACGGKGWREATLGEWRWFEVVREQGGAKREVARRWPDARCRAAQARGEVVRGAGAGRRGGAWGRRGRGGARVATRS